MLGKVLFIKFGMISSTSKSEGDNSVLEDQISELPDEILAYVLSRLSLREAVRTSILSGRWRRIWTLITCLNFDRLNSYYTIMSKNSEKHNFVRWVNQVLELHYAGTIEEFKVCYVLDKRFKYDIDEWIKFALSRKVQRLELDLPEVFYTFSRELFSRSEATTNCLSSRFGTLAHHTLVGLKSLQSLCLKHISVGDEAVEFLLSNCPVLEQLSIHCSLSLVNLKVTGPVCVLKNLELRSCNYIKSIEISDINLVSFKYSGPKINLLLQNVPSLAYVFIGGPIITSYFGSLLNDFFAEISRCLKTLTLELSSFWGTAKARLLPKLISLKELVLEILVKNDVTVLHYVSMIRMAPRLQKFVLQATWEHCLPIVNREVMRIGNCPHHCLEEVRLAGYYGSTSQLELALHFFENAVALERIIIDPRNQCPFSMKNRDTKRQRAARSRAKQQLEGKAPARVKLLIL